MIAAIITLVLVVSGVGTAIAANGAKPGDALFGVDRTVEKVRLTLALSDDSRVRVKTDIAEERDQERAELEERNGSEDERVREADEHAQIALTNALETISEIRGKIEAKGNARATEALVEVESKLRELQEDRVGRTAAAQRGLTEAEVIIFAMSSLVKIEFNDVESEFKFASTDVNVIIEEIAKRTGVPAAVVKAVLKVEYEQGTEDPPKNTNDDRTANTGNTNARQESEDENENENENRNINTPGGTDSAGNTSDPGNGQTAQWEIEVKVENGQADIKAQRSDDRQEWTLTTTDKTAILASIASRTGLTTTEIQAVWQYRVED